MNKNRLIITSIIFVIIIVLIILVPMISFKYSINVVSINNMKATDGKLELTFKMNNERGYFKGTKVVYKKDVAYIYFVGTRFKSYKNKNYNVNIDISKIKKIYIKDNVKEKVIYELKDISS